MVDAYITNVSLRLQAGARVPVAVRAMSTGMLLQFRGFTESSLLVLQQKHAVCAADRTVFELKRALILR